MNFTLKICFVRAMESFDRSPLRGRVQILMLCPVPPNHPVSKVLRALVSECGRIV
jgi:hypothetical protein